MEEVEYDHYDVAICCRLVQKQETDPSLINKKQRVPLYGLLTLGEDRYPLYEACCLGHIECIQYLLKHEADPNLSIPRCRNTPLIELCDLIRCLVFNESGEIEDFAETGKYIEELVEIAKLLMDYGANPYISDTNGDTPFSILGQAEDIKQSLIKYHEERELFNVKNPGE